MAGSYFDEISSINKGLKQQWQQTQAKWRDTEVRTFENSHWRFIEADVMKLQNVADKLKGILEAAQKACKDY